MASIEDCPFCAIGKKYPPSTYVADSEDPTYIVLAAAGTIAFLDRLPLTKCHTLVIPRGHYELLSEFPSDVAADVGRALPIVCRAVLEVSGADAFNVVQNNGVSAGQVVPHAHFHIVPRFREHNSASMFGKGTREELDDEEAIELAGRMREVVEREMRKEKAKL